MLVTGNEILYDARRRQVAVPSPDYFDQQSVRAYIEVAQSLNKPIIMLTVKRLKNIYRLKRLLCWASSTQKELVYRWLCMWIMGIV